MNKERCIVINGLHRSGSTILWNIVACHPDVVLPRLETGELIRKNLLMEFIYRSRLIYWPVVNGLLSGWMKNRFRAMKEASLYDEDHSEKYPGVKYTEEEIRKTILCLKSIGRDYRLNDRLLSMYDPVQIIGLVRNGYAYCNGMERRGASAQRATVLYSQYVDYMLEKQKENKPNFKLVRFEDMVQNPFGIAKDVFEFLGLEPVELEKLRLKAVRVMHKSGEHQTRQEKNEGRHYWFDKESIGEFLDPNVNAAQLQSLSEESRRIFGSYCDERMKALGYEVQD